MRNTTIFAAMLVVAVASAATAQDARTAIAAASKAMGADTLNTVEYSGSGADFTLGQAYSGPSPWPKFIDKTYTRQVDFRVPASKMDRIRIDHYRGIFFCCCFVHEKIIISARNVVDG